MYAYECLSDIVSFVFYLSGNFIICVNLVGWRCHSCFNDERMRKLSQFGFTMWHCLQENWYREQSHHVFELISICLYFLCILFRCIWFDGAFEPSRPLFFFHLNQNLINKWNGCKLIGSLSAHLNEHKFSPLTYWKREQLVCLLGCH